MSFTLIDNHLAPAEGEIVVRTYHCTNLSPVFALIGLKTDGYLTVTNKRVVYFAEGSSAYGAAGNSKLYNEVPIADVTNLSLSKGTRFSFLRLLCGLLFGQIPAVIVTLLLSGVMLALAGAKGGSNPYLLRLGVFLQLTVAILLVVRSMSVPREKIVRIMLAACSVSIVLSIPAFVLTHGGGLPLLPSIYQSGLTILSIPLGCYWLWCLYWFIRREYLTMSITSKSSFYESIRILGVSWWGRVNVAANFAYGMAPAVDANAMFKELGAMISDIQTLGDHGIQKWLNNERESIAKNTNISPALKVCRINSSRYALAAILITGLFVSSESIWYASGAKERLASHLRSQFAAVKSAVESDSKLKEWVPKLLGTANQSAKAGETAFQQGKYTDAAAHWNSALNTYSNLPVIANAMKNASQLQSQYNSNWNTLYFQETVSERLNPASMMGAFITLIDQHPVANQPWKTVKQKAAEARGLDVLEAWTQVANAWGNAASIMPQAYRLMHADICVKSAESEIKKNNASGAMEIAEKALEIVPEYPPAVQRKELAANMNAYNQWTSPDNADELNIPNADDWRPISIIVEKARSLANNNEWDNSNLEWKNALGKIPGVILTLRLEKLKTDARRGNWTEASKLASAVLHDYPDRLRVGELKTKADGIIAAHAAELAYQKTMSDVLNREVENDYIKIGDKTDLVTQMDKYGQEEWAQVKDAVGKAEAFSANEQGVESANEWSKAYTLFPSAVHRMRAEIWMEQADLESKNNNWTKALIYAENALREKPDHVRAKLLRDQADLIEKKRLM